MEHRRRNGCWLGLVFALLLVNISVCAHAATTSGLLTQDETWSGTVYLTGDVSVPEGLISEFSVESGRAKRSG